MARQLLFGLVLLVLVGVTYGTSLGNGFVYDDTMFVRDDPRIRSLETATDLFVQPRWGFDEEARRDIHLYYRPLEALPYLISAVVFDAQPWPAHLLIVAMHALNVLLVWKVIAMLLEEEELRNGADLAVLGQGAGRRDLAALAAAALFAVHPGHSESVLWVAAIGGVGATLFTLLALVLHAGRSRGRSRPFWISMFFLGALFFKETGILVPMLLLGFDLLVARDRGWGRMTRSWATWLAMIPSFVLYVAFRIEALGAFLPGRELNAMPLGGQILNGIAQIPRYFLLFLDPRTLNFFHDFEPVAGPADPWSLAGLALTGAALIAAIAAARRHGLISFAVLLTFVSIAPHLVMRLPGSNLFAERYLYQPAIGLLLILAWMIARLRPVPAVMRRRWVPAILILVVVIFSFRTRARAGDYRDEMTLFRETLSFGQDALPIRTGLVVALVREERFAEALPLAKDLVRREPALSEGWHNLGLVLQQTGDVAGATSAYRRTLAMRPHHESSLLNLAYLLDLEGRRVEATEMNIRLVSLNPGNAGGWWNLAAIAAEEKEWGNARLAVDRVLALRPDDEPARAMRSMFAPRDLAGDGVDPGTRARVEQARRWFEAGNVEQAVLRLRAAAWLDGDAAVPHHYLANIFASIGRRDEALESERAALARDPGNPLYRRNVEALGGR
ncbi:MAG TPA: hypothetical protein VM534_04415 [Thermoanaerobaculia bacterium]|nr:hypothetical protein [Thermoanaerobaculia bacterium]